MKKITLMAFACAMFMVPTAANAQEVTYVEDPAQGYIFNRFQDNWFVEGLGGAGVMLSDNDDKAKFSDRLGWKANLVVGKWFSPVIGLRLGGEFNMMKGAYSVKDALTTPAILGVTAKPAKEAGYGLQHFNNVGAFGDVLLNATNLFCGYKPGRFYNADVYVGFGVHFVYEKDGKGDWKYAGGEKHSRNFSARAGLLNTFRLSNHVNLLLDLRFEEIQEHIDGFGRTWTEYPSALLGLSYRFNKTEWGAPVVSVCPTYKYTDAEGDALVARLAAADRKIADLEEQLKNCRKPAPVVQQQQAPKADAPLATIYYPINVSKIVGVQNNVVDAVANVMANESNNYVLTGWADNYTGNDKINTRLRKDRVAGVKTALVGKGIAADRLDTQINDGNLTNYGPKCASLDRAVTIVRAK